MPRRRCLQVIPVLAGLLLAGCSAEQPRHAKHNLTSPPIPRHVAAHPEPNHAAARPEVHATQEAHHAAVHSVSRHHHRPARPPPPPSPHTGWRPLTTTWGAPPVEASEPDGGLVCKDLTSAEPDATADADDDGRSWRDEGSRNWRRDANCSIVLDLSHDNSTDLLVPVVTNRTIEVKVRLPAHHVASVIFRRPRWATVEVLLLAYSAVNIVATSVIPIPVATTLVPLATILCGLLGGLALNVGTTLVGAYLGLLLVRSRCRPGFERLLGSHHARWLALDRALSEHGAQIPLLIRCSPLSPVVITNVLLSLTSVSQFTYMWTCLVGEVLTSLPYAYATHVGLSTLEIGLGQDPVLLLLSCLGIAASLAIAWKVGVVAKALLELRTGMGDGDAACEDDESRDASTVPLRQKRSSRVDAMRTVDSKASMSSEEC